MTQPFTSQRYTGPTAMAGLGALLTRDMPAARLLMVGDDATLAAASAQVKAQLPPATHTDTHSLGQRLRAEKRVADALVNQLNDYDAVLAIGAGTVNDLCKYAAFTAAKPYAVVATAASMNGYSSANASLEVDGHKHSFACRSPVAVIAETGILTAAPKRLTRAGIGDTLCRTTVEADMLLSHLLFGTPYPRAVFDVLRKHEEQLLVGLMKARDGEDAFVACLMEALLDAGDAMTTYGSSAVASQGEHMIAHTLELKYGSELLNLLHGELIAVTSLTMSQLQHRMLLGTPAVKRMDYSSEQFLRQFGLRLAEPLAAAYTKKLLNDEQVAVLNPRLEKEWPAMMAELSSIMLPTNTLERALIHSGINTKATQIGLAEERYRFATSYAHLTRERFTFLDLAAMNVKRMN